MLGVIADDYTGATDVAAILRRAQLSVGLVFGPPRGWGDLPGFDAVVAGLKTRGIPPAAAVADSLDALAGLRGQGATWFYVKYCSTFDSTSDGNIGPIVEAVMGEVGARTSVVCPASPAHGRTVYQGHLFVGTDLLSDSPMRHHPITPMTDANLRRVLTPQTASEVGNVVLAAVEKGTASIVAALSALRARGVAHAVVDALTDDHLESIAAACGEHVLPTGAAGLAGALGAVTRARSPVGSLAVSVPDAGRSLVVAGSCSPTTLSQVEVARGVLPHHQVTPRPGVTRASLLAEATAWIDARRHEREPMMLVASAAPDERIAAVRAFGSDAGTVLEQVLADAARYAVATAGIDRVVVAGGETSGAVIEALEIHAAQVAGELDVGVPWLLPTTGPVSSLALKSGNFGSPDLLIRSVAPGPADLEVGNV